MPEEISKLKSLRILILSHNKIEELPETIGELQSLQALTLSENRLKRLPESIGNLENLRLFSMHGNWNKITLPSSFWNLKKLEIIDLA